MMNRFAGAALLLLTPLSLLGVSLTRGPYLGRPDDRSVAVIWRTDAVADSRVDYAPLEIDSWMTVRRAESVITHKMRIDGLEPGAVYRYHVYSNDVPLGEEATFRAPRDPSQRAFTFAVIGDTNQRWIPEIIAHHLVEEAPDLAIHTGDVVYPDGADEGYDDEFFKPLSVFVRQAPVLPIFGDHDTKTRRGAPLLDNFVLPDSGTNGGSRFYAFRQASALFVAVDIETSPFGRGSAQYEWLIRKLSETDATWKFVYLHEPPYSSDRSSGVARLVLGPVFERYGVDVVFSGNSHLYERTFPICDFGWRGCRGVTYITEGGGGAGFSDFRAQRFTAFVMARHGYTIGTIGGDVLTLTSHDMDGHVVDEIVLQKKR